MSRALVPLLLLVSSACAPLHVRLAPAPKPDAPLEERRAFYDEHRPVLLETADDLGAFTPTASLQLHNGVRVHHPADLLPHVDEASPTAEATRRLEAAEESLLLWRTVSIGVSVAALGGLLTSMLFFEEALPLVALGGSGALALIALPLALLPTHFAATAALERETAFLTYDRSLREQLALTPRSCRAPHGGASEETDPADEPPPLLRALDARNAAPANPDAPLDPVDELCAALPALDPDGLAPPAP